MRDEIIDSIRRTCPRIHSITNTITVNDCANIILAAGGSAVMASDPDEVSEMTSLCDGLVLNLGAVASREAMLRAGKTANCLNHPIVFDPVAAGSTTLRRETSLRLMEELRLTAIRGNASEIHALAAILEEGREEERQSFVDAEKSQIMQEANLERCLADAERLSRHTGAIIVVSGIEDLIVQGDRYQVCRGGSALSSRITGSGCMLSELMGTCLAAAWKEKMVGGEQEETAVASQPISEWDAVRAAVEWMNEAAERAEEKTKEVQGGTMTYRMVLIDEISRWGDYSCSKRIFGEWNVCQSS